MKITNTQINRCARIGVVNTIATAIIILGSVAPSWAKKGGSGGGGNGGGGGEEPPPAVELVTPPVHYQITWLDWLEETTR
jgi:hypothetical protein